MEKRKVGIITSNPLVRTGFSDNARAILANLFKSDKYELFLLSQGTHAHDVNLQKFPWKSFGTINPDEINHQRWQSDPGYQRFVSYGGESIKNFVIKNKLDVVIHIEDIWSADEGSYLNSEWFKHFKNNFLQWTTLDSETILDLGKKWASSCNNFWVWASFAERALKNENSELYKHVKTVPGTTDLDNFYPLSTVERFELRDKFGIKTDEKIIFYLGRNQLRKLYWANLEALAKFKKLHPENKVRLLFHCSWEEKHQGWDMKRIMNELGLDNNDVLTSYYCTKCSYWNVQPVQR